MKFAGVDHLDGSGPDRGRQYEDRLRLTEIYEWAGFHAYHVAEHHGTPLGSAPSPGLFLAAVAQRTTRLRFGPLAYPLGLYHPLRLIAELCMLDVMSVGALELGAGRAASPEQAAFVVLDSDSDAVSAARRAFHVWYGSMVHLWRANGVELPRQVSSPDFDETVEQGYIVAGSPAKVRDRMLRDQSISGINYSICRFACGDLSFEESARSVRLFAREVMPALLPKDDTGPVRAATGTLARGLRWLGDEDLSEVGFLFR